MFKLWIGDLIRVSHGWIPADEFLYEKDIFERSKWNLHKIWIIVELENI